MALSRGRKTELIIIAGELLKRIPSDRAIQEAGGTVLGEIIPIKGPDEAAFLEELLDNIMAFAKMDIYGNLRVGPR